MKSTAGVLARRPSRKACRGLWKRLEESLRRRAKVGSERAARERRGS